MRKEVIDTFKMSYKLKTLENGAIVREWPGGFCVWMEDPTLEDGYKMLGNFGGDLNMTF
jgi:hypothetical protein